LNRTDLEKQEWELGQTFAFPLLNDEFGAAGELFEHGALLIEDTPERRNRLNRRARSHFVQGSFGNDSDEDAAGQRTGAVGTGFLGKVLPHLGNRAMLAGRDCVDVRFDDHWMGDIKSAADWHPAEGLVYDGDVRFLVGGFEFFSPSLGHKPILVEVFPQ
jgi:hypothetical protein